MNGYEHSSNWFNWCFENTEKINPNHTALYFYILERANKMGWKDNFGLPMEIAKEAIGIKNYRTYSKTFEDLISFGFIKIITKTKNQNTCTVIALVKNTKAHTKAHTKAMQTQGQSNVGVIKHQTNKHQTSNIDFSVFWDLYDKKIGLEKSKSKWEKLSDKEREKIIEFIPRYKIFQPDKNYRKNPETFFNNKSWNDEIFVDEKKENNFSNQHEQPFRRTSPLLQLIENGTKTKITHPDGRIEITEN